MTGQLNCVIGGGCSLHTPNGPGEIYERPEMLQVEKTRINRATGWGTPIEFFPLSLLTWIAASGPIRADQYA